MKQINKKEWESACDNFIERKLGWPPSDNWESVIESLVEKYNIDFNLKKIMKRDFNDANHKYNYCCKSFKNALYEIPMKEKLSTWIEHASVPINDSFLKNNITNYKTLAGPINTEKYTLLLEELKINGDAILLNVYYWKYELNSNFLNKFESLKHAKGKEDTYTRINFAEYKNSEYVSFSGIKSLFDQQYKSEDYKTISDKIKSHSSKYFFESKGDFTKIIIELNSNEEPDAEIPITGYNIYIRISIKDHPKVKELINIGAWIKDDNYYS